MKLKGLVLGLLILTIGFIAFTGKIIGGKTNPIRDEKGNILPNSIAKLEKVKIGGMDQWILMRGNNTENPVLLWLHGGPGSSQMPIAHRFDGELEKEFIVVHWDQRGAGKSNPFHFNEHTMTFEQFVSDGHELTQYLKKKFQKDKIYLVGHSWGTQFGSKMAQLYPNDYYAFVAISQVVDTESGAKLSYDWLAQKIKDSGKKKDQELLQSIGKPPYTDHKTFVKFAKTVEAYGGGMDLGMAKLIPIALRSSEYTLLDYIRWLRGATRGSGPMWNAGKPIKLSDEITELHVPVYYFSGQNDYNTPAQMVRNYIEHLKAPKKELVIFEKSSHAPFMGEPDKFVQEMLRVKAETWK